jgi:hypothetical protein
VPVPLPPGSDTNAASVTHNRRFIMTLLVFCSSLSVFLYYVFSISERTDTPLIWAFVVCFITIGYPTVTRPPPPRGGGVGLCGGGVVCCFFFFFAHNFIYLAKIWSYGRVQRNCGCPYPFTEIFERNCIREDELSM